MRQLSQKQSRIVGTFIMEVIFIDESDKRSS